MTASALAGKPVVLHLVTGAAAVIFTDLALFGYHLSPGQRGALVAGVSALLGVSLHLAHVTTTAARRPPGPAAPPAFPVRPSTPVPGGTEADLLEQRARYAGPWVPPHDDQS